METKKAPKKASPKKTTKKVNQSVEELIEKRAYAIWESKGRPEGNHFNDWLEAEEQLKNEGVLGKK